MSSTNQSSCPGRGLQGCPLREKILKDVQCPLYILQVEACWSGHLSYVNISKPNGKSSLDQFICPSATTDDKHLKFKSESRALQTRTSSIVSRFKDLSFGKVSRRNAEWTHLIVFCLFWQLHLPPDPTQTGKKANTPKTKSQKEARESNLVVLIQDRWIFRHVTCLNVPRYFCVHALSGNNCYEAFSLEWYFCCRIVCSTFSKRS